MSQPKLLLASASPYRRQLLQKLGIEFSWAASNANETPKANESPTELVSRLAQLKAEQLAVDFPQHLIIGCDQVAVFSDEIVGKPGTHEAATRQLQRLCGNEVQFIVGLCLHNSRTGITQLSTDSCKVKLRKLSNIQIENYLRYDQPYDCAGSFKSEALGICLLEKIEGKDPNTLIGLPLIELTQMLINEGVDPLMH